MRKSKSGPLLESDDDVSLYCDVDANPEAEIAWLKSTPGEVCKAFLSNGKDGITIANDHSLQEEKVLTLSSELAIKGVKRGDAGKCVGFGEQCLARDQSEQQCSISGLYYCVAKNTRGLVNKSLELEVYCKCSLVF